MLGSLIRKQDWEWTAWGKHPAAMDYFQLGPSTPLVKAFRGWIEKGYQQLMSASKNRSEFLSWRFWARGNGKGHIACGIGRDSSDGLGRPYPLLIMGTGSLFGWEGHWDLLPNALESVWGDMEYLAARKHRDFDSLKIDLRGLRPPHSQWSDWSASKDTSTHERLFEESASAGIRITEIEDGVIRLREQGALLINLGTRAVQDQSNLVRLWHSYLRSKLGVIPNAAFVGGASIQTSLAVFKRALSPSDFVTLWSIGT